MNNDAPKGSNTYREQQIMTASPARLVAMLYEKAIVSLRLAIKAIEDGDIKARWKANARAVEIIEHLSMTLDSDKGGEIAANLDRLYPFMIRQLINVDLHNDPEPARDVIGLLEPLYESWCILDRQMAQQNAGTLTTTASPASAVGSSSAETPPGGGLAAIA